jgi:flagellar motor switch protein FliG
MAKGLTVKIRADASQFEKTMRGVRGGLNSVAGPLKAVGVAAAAAGAAIVGAGVAAGVLVKKLIEIGEGANTASARTANAVKQMGVFGERSGEVAERLDDVATATALQTGVDKKSIQMTQAKLATFKELLKTADQQEGAFDRVTMAAINLAAAGFGSAEENATQLGKAFSDVEEGLTALKRAGTLTRQEIEDISSEFKATGDQGKAFERVLQALEVQSKNAAAATSDGTKRIGVAWQLLKEEIGKPIAEEFSKLADFIAGETPRILASIQAMSPKIAEAARGVFTAISEAIQGDFNKLVAIGEFIGDAVAEGFKLATAGMFSTFSQKLYEHLGEYTRMEPIHGEGPNRFTRTAEYMKEQAEIARRQKRREATRNLSSRHESLMAQLNTPSQSIPQMFGGRPMSPIPESNDLLREIRNTLADISRKTPTPLLFPGR